MFYNKILQIRISQELLVFLQEHSSNTSRFVRNLIRSEIKRRRKTKDMSRDIRPEVRAKTPYTFLANLIRVLDGDTILVRAQLGFYIRAEVKLRLSGINAPKPNTPEGKKAILFLKQRLARNNMVIESRQRGKYGRYIGYVYYHRTYKEFEDILRYGKVINEELLKGGLVKRYK